MKSPFKFLDSYTKDDREIFFGREREIEELYHRVFESKIMLVYGVSGTGKSSLIHCGLANKFSETDWLPIVIRRGRNMIESLASGISSASLTDQISKFSNPADFKKGVRSLYLDHYKPVFFIFDQFEELFIFGSKEEKKSIIQIIKALIDSEVQCRFILVMREEYMAGITEFEKYIPNIFSNRVRIEKMSHSSALEAIEGPCKVANINLQDGFAEALLEKLSPDSADVELTYLQVFLDKIYRLSENGDFNLSLISKVGNVSDLLGSFLDEQISHLGSPDDGLAVLKSFVSVKGTKRQMSSEEVLENSKTLGRSISKSSLNELLQTFINLRILRDKDVNEKYELRHDALANKIYEKITLVEKELLEIRQFIENAFSSWQKRNALLSREDLNYIGPYESKLYLPEVLYDFIEKSKNQIAKINRRRRNLITVGTGIILIVFGSFTIWALTERKKAETQKYIAEQQKNEAIKANQLAEAAKQEAIEQRGIAIGNEKIAEESKKAALNAKTIAENELYKNIKNSLSVSAEKMNVFYLGIANPVKIAVSGIPGDKVRVSSDNGSILKADEKTNDSQGESYIVKPASLSNVNITVFGEIKPGKVEYIGKKAFRVKSMPYPYATFAERSSGNILKEDILKTNELQAKIDIDFDSKFVIKQFTILYSYKGNDYEEASINSFLTPKQLDLVSRLRHNSNLIIKDIKVEVDGTAIIDLPPLVLKVYDNSQILRSENDSLIYRSALDFIIASYQAPQSEKGLFYYKGIELFDSIKTKSIYCLLDELRILSEYSEMKNHNNVEQRVIKTKDDIISYKWNTNNIDSVFNISYKFSFVFMDNLLLNESLRLPELLYELINKLHKTKLIGDNQKKTIADFCGGVANNLFYLKSFKKSLDFYLLGQSIEDLDPYNKRLLPFLYLFNDMYKEAENEFIMQKDKQFQEGYPETYGHYFRRDIESYEKEGFNHPDLEKAKKLLKQ